MRSIAFSLTFFCALGLEAASPKLAPPDEARQEQTINSVRQFAASHLDRDANLSCAQAPASAKTKGITVEFTDAPHRGVPSNLDTAALIKDVFAPSSGADFEWDHYGTIGGKALTAYRYSYQVNGKTHAGMIYADENTGAISRITFRAADAPAYLFCSAKAR